MKQVVLKSWVCGNPLPENFAIEEVPMPVPAEREILVKTLWLALDPLIRFAMDEKRISGAVQLALGDVVYAPAVAQVIESNHPDYAAGDFIEDRTGWREYAVIAPDKADWRGPPRKLDSALGPIRSALGALGMPGQTAHAGIVGIGRVKAGETVVISAAAGAVGTIAGQIASILGARAVGIAGGPDKCAALLELGFAATADYKAPDFAAQLKAACPDGIDVYLDNVGGDVTLAVLPLLKYGARMPVCGFIAYYGMGLEGPGPDHLPGFFRTIMSKGLKVRGFGGFMVGGQQALDDIAGWIADGRLKVAESIVAGIDAVPQAFAGVFSGNSHVGKVLVKVAEPD